MTQDPKAATDDLREVVVDLTRLVQLLAERVERLEEQAGPGPEAGLRRFRRSLAGRRT